MQGECTTIKAPMGAHGLEGYFKGGVYKFQKARGSSGAEWFRVFPHERCYETCSSVVFFAHFKINPPPGVNEATQA